MEQWKTVQSPPAEEDRVAVLTCVNGITIPFLFTFAAWAREVRAPQRDVKSRKKGVVEMLRFGFISHYLPLI